jgi:tetratricopeptide (TPR) repeat protein
VGDSLSLAPPADLAVYLHAWQLEARLDHQGLRSYLESLPPEQVLPDPELATLLLNTLVTTFANEKARALALNLSRMLAPGGNTRNYRRVLNQQGILAFREGDLPSAAAFFDELEWLSRSAGDELTLGYALANGGIVLDIQCEHHAAISRYQRALSVARRTRTRAWLGGVYNNIAMTLRQLERFQDAADHFEKAMRCRLSPEHRATNMSERAVLHHVTGDDKVAEMLARGAVSYFDEVGAASALADALRVLAMVVASKDLDAGRGYLERALAVLPPDELMTHAEIYEEIARVEIMAGDPARSEAAQERSAELYQQLGAPKRAERMRLRVARWRP